MRACFDYRVVAAAGACCAGCSSSSGNGSGMPADHDASTVAMDASTSDADAEAMTGTPDASNSDVLISADADHDAAEAGSSAGSIVPLYSYPTDSTWATMAQTKKKYPSVDVVAIVNVNSGPGTAVDPNFTTGITSLESAGIRVAAYVDTQYTMKSLATVEGQIDLWINFYPNVQGMMFDEMGVTPGQESYYTTLTSYAKSHGATFTVANAGTSVPQSFVGTVDMIQVYENSGVPPLGSLAGFASEGPGNFSIIPYAVGALDTSYVQSARNDVKYIFITNGTLPNPWNQLPPYFDSLIAALQ